MRYILVILLLIFSTGLSIGQPVKKTVTLHLIKESKRIDSLLDLIPDSVPKNAFLSIFIGKLPGQLRIFIQHFKSSDQSVYYPSTDPNSIDHFGYFKYNDYTILVSGSIDSNIFFNQTNKRKSFIFIWSNPLYYQDLHMYFNIDYEYIEHLNKFKVDNHMYH